METLKSEFMIVSNNKIYDLTLSTKKQDDDDFLDMTVHPETDSPYFYKMFGSITNLIDQDRQWKKFDIPEIVEIIKDNIETKSLELETSEEFYLVYLQVIINSKKNKYFIKLIKSLKQESINEDSNMLAKIFNLTTQNSFEC